MKTTDAIALHSSDRVQRLVERKIYERGEPQAGTRCLRWSLSFVVGAASRREVRA
ncbi:hypothetical protein [Nostoc sp.]